MDLLKMHLDILKIAINNLFEGKEPWQIASITTSTVLFIVWLYEFTHRDETLLNRSKKTLFKIMRYFPQIRNKIKEELEKVNTGFEEGVKQRTEHLKYIVNLPAKGLNSEAILSLLDKNLSVNRQMWKNGRASGAAYVYNDELLSLVGETYKLASYTNPLHPDLFPGICKMEAEVVRILCTLFHGDEYSCGSMTTGGTESILMACKAYRDFARDVRGVRRPEMVLPTTAHSGFNKAGLYLGIRLRHVPLDENTCQVNIRAMKKAINSNTIMLVGSAPNFPYGTIDDIENIANLGIKYNIPVHVDSCLGGLLTAFMDKAGYPTPVTDFRLKGVTSISVDTHKYGFAPKGTSVVLYREEKYRNYQYTVTTDWPGGVYGSPTVGGSRSGGNIAACWSTLLYYGLDGYVDVTRDIIHTSRYIEKGLRRYPEIFIFGQPGTSVIAFGSKRFDIYRLLDGLHKLGWHLNPLQYPPGIHICITQMHTNGEVADDFLNDVKICLKEIMTNPEIPVEGAMALYGTAQKIPDRSIVGDITKKFLDSLYYIPNLKELQQHSANSS